MLQFYKLSLSIIVNIQMMMASVCLFYATCSVNRLQSLCVGGQGQTSRLKIVPPWWALCFYGHTSAMVAIRVIWYHEEEENLNCFVSCFKDFLKWFSELLETINLDKVSEYKYKQFSVQFHKYLFFINQSQFYAWIQKL